MITPPTAALPAALSGALLAYIGPGAGLGALVFTIALVLGAVLLLFGLVWYPLKRVLKGRSQDPAGEGPTDASA
jgi:hypothetical protein